MSLKCPFSGIDVQKCPFYQVDQQCGGGSCPIDTIANTLCCITSILEKQENMKVPLTKYEDVTMPSQIKCPFSGIDVEECPFPKFYENPCLEACPVMKIREQLNALVPIMLKKAGLKTLP